MRRTLLTLTVLAVLAGGAQAASATVPAGDNPNATIDTFPSDDSGNGAMTQMCTTPPSLGVRGQYGAWGNFIAGCTVRLPCPATARRACSVTGVSEITFNGAFTQPSTWNTRVRWFHNGVVTGWRDSSSTCPSPGAWCSLSAAPLHVAPGDEASLQANGVRQSPFGPWQVLATMQVRGWIDMTPLA